MPIEAYSRVDSIYINDKPEEGKLPLWASVRSFSHVYSVAGGSNGSLTGFQMINGEKAAFESS